jgi:L-lactate dehydrogenase
MVLIGQGNKQLVEEIIDLQNGYLPICAARIWAGDYSDAQAADIAVIFGGVEALDSDTPAEALEKNIVYTRSVAGKLKAAGFDGVILITTTPVDILAQIALEESDFPAEKVIGSGLDLRHFSEAPTDKKEKLPKDCVSCGQAGAGTWCASLVSDVPLVDFCTPTCSDFGAMLERIKRDGQDFAGHKEYALFEMGSCVTKISESILCDEHTLLPVSTMSSGQYGISGVYLNLPCVIGRSGVESVIDYPLSKAEREKILASAELVAQTLAQLENKTPLTADKL